MHGKQRGTQLKGMYSPQALFWIPELQESKPEAVGSR